MSDKPCLRISRSMSLQRRRAGLRAARRVLRRNAGETDDHLSVDLRVEKGFDVLAGLRVAVIAEAFNIFNEEFYTNYDVLHRWRYQASRRRTGGPATD